jgi:hypothetical protein
MSIVELNAKFHTVMKGKYVINMEGDAFVTVFTPATATLIGELSMMLERVVES